MIWKTFCIYLCVCFPCKCKIIIFRFSCSIPWRLVSNFCDFTLLYFRIAVLSNYLYCNCCLIIFYIVLGYKFTCYFSWFFLANSFPLACIYILNKHCKLMVTVSSCGFSTPINNNFLLSFNTSCVHLKNFIGSFAIVTWNNLSFHYTVVCHI